MKFKFESDETMKASVFGLVHDTNATSAKLLDDAVMRDGLANHCARPTGGMLGVARYPESIFEPSKIR